jgi:hypothetical protein
MYLLHTHSSSNDSIVGGKLMMTSDSLKIPARSERVILSLSRRARVLAILSLTFAIVSGVLLAAGTAGTILLLMQPTQTTTVVTAREDLQQRVLEVEALKKSGESAAIAVLGFLIVLCMSTAIGLGRKWARAVSELISESDPENRDRLRLCRVKGFPIALFLRGFEQEGKSFKKMFTVPLPQTRVTKATRWIESEIVDELTRRNVTVFCIANPADSFLLPGACRLIAEDETWFSEVKALATDSTVVVIYISALSPGLLAELELLSVHPEIPKIQDSAMSMLLVKNPSWMTFRISC